jgi:hypothetical protein
MGSAQSGPIRPVGSREAQACAAARLPRSMSFRSKSCSVVSSRANSSNSGDGAEGKRRRRSRSHSHKLGGLLAKVRPRRSGATDLLSLQDTDEEQDTKAGDEPGGARCGDVVDAELAAEIAARAGDADGRRAIAEEQAAARARFEADMSTPAAKRPDRDCVLVALERDAIAARQNVVDQSSRCLKTTLSMFEGIESGALATSGRVPTRCAVREVRPCLDDPSFRRVAQFDEVMETSECGTDGDSCGGSPAPSPGRPAGACRRGWRITEGPAKSHSVTRARSLAGVRDAPIPLAQPLL